MIITLHVFILGSKGIPARYGGFETFVDQLVSRRTDTGIQYHVACLDSSKSEAEYRGARCFHLPVPNMGPAKAVYYDLAALGACRAYIRKHAIENAVVCLLTCRVGPFMGYHKKKLAAMGVPLIVNPDGLEWSRAGWNAAIRRYWKLSERLTVKQADLLVCDSRAIEGYIRGEYGQKAPPSLFIPYGAELGVLPCKQEAIDRWYARHGLAKGDFYLAVGRFVPENNYETMLRGFMRSSTGRKLVFISNVQRNRFYESLRAHTGFDRDPRICFAGTVYDQALLARIRREAHASLHGHEAGGTNPSLLEALAMTDMNLVLDVVFNREVAEDSALYWEKTPDSLAAIIDAADRLTLSERQALGERAKQRVATAYNWPDVVANYERAFRRIQGGKITT